MAALGEDGRTREGRNSCPSGDCAAALWQSVPGSQAGADVPVPETACAEEASLGNWDGKLSVGQPWGPPKPPQFLQSQPRSTRDPGCSRPGSSRPFALSRNSNTLVVGTEPEGNQLCL